MARPWLIVKTRAMPAPVGCKRTRHGIEHRNPRMRQSSRPGATDLAWKNDTPAHVILAGIAAIEAARCASVPAQAGIARPFHHLAHRGVE